MNNDEFQLTESNFVLYAMKSYDCRNCLDIKEFYDDLKKIKYIKRLFNRYLNEGELKERLLVNHIVELYNMFGSNATNMLFFKLEDKFYPILKTFLVYLNRCPESVAGVKDEIIYTVNIPIDMEVANTLRNL